MRPQVRIQLSVMMFIQFFVWGAWAVTMGTYLLGIGFQPSDVGNAYSTTAWAAVVAPFFIGMIADRFFPAQIVLGILHLLGAALMYWTSTLTTPGLFFIGLLGYALCYMPTLALVNAISFNQMSNPQKQFPAVRVLGTLGWIAAGFFLSMMKWEPTVYPLQLAAGASLIMGIYSFTLPHTPPKGTGQKVTVSDILGLKALRLMKEPSFAIFVISSLLICVPLAFYYAFTNSFLVEKGVANSARMQSFGQISEVVFMVLMPFFFRRLGVKKMLLIGMAAWAVRYVLFAYGNNTSLVSMYWMGILLHGICYDFFFVTGQIYVDKKAPQEVQASAQGFIGMVTYGAGMIIGNFLAGRVVGMYQLTEKTFNWQAIWIIPAIMAAVITVVFFVTFRESKDLAVDAQGQAAAEKA